MIAGHCLVPHFSKATPANPIRSFRVFRVFGGLSVRCWLGHPEKLADLREAFVASRNPQRNPQLLT
jgi:hypothetical protein